MKKFLIILLALIVVIIGLLVTVPIIFKDDIVAAVDREIDKNVKADVYFDADRVGISFFKQFPNLTLTLADFGVVGIEQFAQDTLVSVDEFDLTVDVMSVIRGDQIRLRSINLVNPRITVIVMEDGTANYDIAVETEEAPEEPAAEDTTELKIGIDSWSIENGYIGYYDMSSNLLMVLEEINHKGSGDFTLDVFDMKTMTSIGNIMVEYDDVSYMDNKQLRADLTLNMDLENSKYTFRENKLSLNDFNFGFDGYFAMPGQDYEMDITYEGKDNSVKSILSLVPGAFTEEYEEVKATGDIRFNGFVRGTYSEDPGRMPAFNFHLITSDGMIQYPDLPESIRNINIDLLVENGDGIIENTTIALNKGHLEFGQNPVDATFLIKNLRNYDMEAGIKANLDLGNINEIYPLENTTLAGMVDMEVNINGAYDSVLNTIPASGNITVTNMEYTSPDFPQGFGISNSSLSINEHQVEVKNFAGYAGKTDLNLSGFLSNYMAYAMEENQLLTGEFNFNSELVDLNEWMTAEDTVDTDEADTTELEVIKVPEDIDFVLRSKIEKILYDDLELRNARGNIIVRDGIVRLENLDFNTLDGDFMVSGTYNTKDMENPAFDFNLSIEKLAIPKAYQSFVAVQQFAPIARIMDGSFSTDFRIGGNLQQNMMPDLSTLNGSGILEVINAAVRGSESKVISGITSVSKLSGQSTNVTLNDVLISTEIADGRVYVQPFTVNFGNQKAVIAGSNGLDGSLDYQVKLDVPPGAVNTAASLVSSAVGQNLNVNATDVKLNLGITGTYDDPNVKILGAETGSTAESAKQALKAKMEEEKDKVKKEAEKIVEEEKEKAAEKAKEVVEEKKDEVKEEVDKAKDKLKKFFKRDGG